VPQTRAQVARDDDTATTPRRTRQASQFEIVFEEPPPAPNSVVRGALYQMLEKLSQEAPGQWARVATCNSRSGANSIKSTISSGKRKVPGSKDNWEFTARIDKDDNKSYLFARYVGSES
jgi:hypothetical protein